MSVVVDEIPAFRFFSHFPPDKLLRAYDLFTKAPKTPFSEFNLRAYLREGRPYEDMCPIGACLLSCGVEAPMVTIEGDEVYYGRFGEMGGISLDIPGVGIIDAEEAKEFIIWWDYEVVLRCQEYGRDADEVVSTLLSGAMDLKQR